LSRRRRRRRRSPSAVALGIVQGRKLVCVDRRPESVGLRQYYYNVVSGREGEV
jgi:hypothetical protein